MIFFVLLLAVVLAAQIYQRHLNPNRGRQLHRSIEDGDQSSLYLRTSRSSNCAGGVTFVYFKRLTCVPAVRYTVATSDWLQPWRGYSNKVCCHFERVGDEFAQKMLADQRPATRAVKHESAERRKAGRLKQNEGFGVPRDGCAA